jgi:NADP-dependent 3-hydroxy acid dehydrogenase YdfG
MRISGANVLITGGAGGIGKAMALEFARQGADLFLSDTNEEGLQPIRGEIESLGRQCHLARTDVSRKEQVKEMIDAAVEQMGHVDILVNNAGVTVISEIKDEPLEDWEWIVGINLWGQIYGVHYILPQGHIVNMGSMCGLNAVPANGSYCVTKFGITALSETLRAELSKHNIRVTLICPGFLSCGEDFESRGRIRGLSKFKPGGFAKGGVMSVEKAAARFVRGVEKDQFLVTTGLIGPVFNKIKSLFPWLYHKVGEGMAADLEKWR